MFNQKKHHVERRRTWTNIQCHRQRESIPRPASAWSKVVPSSPRGKAPEQIVSCALRAIGMPVAQGRTVPWLRLGGAVYGGRERLARGRIQVVGPSAGALFSGFPGEHCRSPLQGVFNRFSSWCDSYMTYICSKKEWGRYQCFQ
jgi:hypothetical protein